MRIVILGLTITSSWGNGHATTYRGLVRGLARRGHQVLFLEWDKPWYADNRDMPAPPWGETRLYSGLDELAGRWSGAIAAADLVVVGSYVPDGAAVGALAQRLAGGTVAFYDIDTPVTLAALETGACDYLTPELLRGFDLYLSFTGGPTLQYLEATLGARAARALYCSADPEVYRPDPDTQPTLDLGYLGTYSRDRQPTVDVLLCQPAQAWPEGRFAVAGPLYPAEIAWPANVERVEHLAPDRHRAFYAGQRFTLNVTRADMIQRGYSPSVRLFEAACCGVPIISDWWAGLDAFFKPDEEILIARDAGEVLRVLRSMPEARRREVADAARARVLGAHTGDHRAAELEAYAAEAAQGAHAGARRTAHA
ncbi:MAG TPA: glycosyltransferase [Acetobacteraceae bacterium]